MEREIENLKDMNQITITLRELIRLVIECKQAEWSTYEEPFNDTFTFFTAKKEPMAPKYFEVDEWIGFYKDGNDITVIHKNNKEINTYEQLITWVKGEGK